MELSLCILGKNRVITNVCIKKMQKVTIICLYMFLMLVALVHQYNSINNGARRCPNREECSRFFNRFALSWTNFDSLSGVAPLPTFSVQQGHGRTNCGQQSYQLDEGTALQLMIMQTWQNRHIGWELERASTLWKSLIATVHCHFKCRSHW